MATHTAGQQESITGPQGLGVLTAPAAKYASTTPWPPKLHGLQLSGTMRQMMIHLTLWSRRAIRPLIGCVMLVITSGEQMYITGSAGAPAANNVQSSRHGPGAQPLQITPSWLSGITDATRFRTTILTAQLWEVASRSSGSATSAEQDSCTAGLLHLLAALAASSQVARSVLGRWHADATRCRHSTLAWL